jgi:PAS domain S-box-containing protein
MTPSIRSTATPERPALLRYSVAVVVSLLALGIRLLLEPLLGDSPHFLLFFGAVMAASWFGGFGPGALATALSALLSDIFFVPPRYGFAPLDLAQSTHLLIFVIEGLLISVLSGQLYRARSQVAQELAVRAAAEQEASAQREQLRVTLTSIGDAVIVTDVAERVTFLNPLAEQLTGWPAAEALGLPLSAIFNIVNEQTRAPVESPVRRVIREGVVVGLANHTLLLDRKGGEHPIDDSGAPVRASGGAILGAVLVFRDVTARRQADAALQASRDQLAVILQGVADGITAQDLAGRLVYTNDAAAHASGFPSAAAMLASTPAEVLAKFAIMDEDGRPLPLDQLPGRQALQGAPDPERVLRYRDLATGAERWSLVKSTPVRDAEGRVQLAINILHDVTERRRVEQNQRFLADAGALLAESLDYNITLRSLAELCVPYLADWCAIDIVDEQGHLQRLILHHSDPDKDARLGELYRQFPSDPNGPDPTMVALRTGETILLPEIPDELLVAAAQDAQVLEFVRGLGLHSSLYVPLRTRGYILGVITLATAESRRRYGAAERALAEELAHRAALAVDNARLYSQTQAALLARNAFLVAASHELKTPITSLLGYAQMLERRLLHDGAASERNRRAVEVIAGQALRLNTLLESLLDFSRIQAGHLAVQPEPMDLGALARRLVEELRATLDHHTISYTGSPDPLLVQGDELRLEQVFQNLLQNAVKYSPEGGPIEVQAERRGDQACVSVSDRGIGIPAAELPVVFRRFYRSPNSPSRHIAGMGVGLYVVKEILSRHGGTVEVTSEEGAGSTFTVCLPLVQ